MTATYSPERNLRAEQVILSDHFYQGARRVIDDHIGSKGGTVVDYYQSDFLVREEDLPLLQTVFNRLKQEYPQLDHVRLNSVGTIIFDTKKNTFWRRLNTDHPEF